MREGFRAGEVSSGKGKILVVDDNDSILHLITAVDDEDIAQGAMREGAADYVTKPLDLNYLDTVVTFQLME